MTNLAALTNTATPKPPDFKAEFYVVTATVIPVLFLALVVQGPVYREVLRRTWLGSLNVFRFLSEAEPSSYFRDPPSFLGPAWALAAIIGRVIFGLVLGFVLAFGIVVIAAGGYGELLAIYALYQAQDQHTTRLIVFIATMLLVILVIAGPLFTYVINAFNLESASQPQQDGTSEPEASKTDQA